MTEEENWSRDDQPFLNPYTSVMLIQGLAAIRALMDGRQYLDAAHYARIFVIFLDPEIKNKLEKERKKLENAANLPSADLIAILDKISDELHKAKYFIFAKGLKPLVTGGRSLGSKPTN